MSQANVEIFSSTKCPYCKRAKDLLQSKGVQYEEYVIENNPEYLTEIAQRCNRNGVPQIFIDGDHVGGFDDLKALNDQSLLDSKLGIQ